MILSRDQEMVRAEMLAIAEAGKLAMVGAGLGKKRAVLLIIADISGEKPVIAQLSNRDERGQAYLAACVLRALSGDPTMPLAEMGPAS